MARNSFGRIDKRPNGRFRARYVNFADPYDEKGAPNLITLPGTFDTRTAARIALNEIQSDHAKGLWKSPEQLAAEKVEAQIKAARDALTFGTYATGWIKARKLTHATARAYQSNLDTHLLPRWGNTPLKAITTADIRAWLAELAPNYPGARRKAAELFRTILNTAADDDLIPVSPYKRNMLSTVKAPEPTRELKPRQTQALEFTELEALANEVPEYLRLLVLLSGYCGLRSGEARELRGRDIDTVDTEDGNATVYVNITRAVSGSGKDLKVDTPKTAESVRSIPVPATIALEILNLAKIVGDNGLLFHPVGEPWRHIPERTYQINVKRAGERLDLGHIAPHDFRRTMTTNFIALGVPLSDVQKILGHTTPSMTMRYAKSDQQRVNRAIETLNTHLDNRECPSDVSSLDERRAANQ